jgi:hypothetical protein
VELLFVAGYEYTVESSWRCVLPARGLGAQALMIDDALRAPRADVCWIHQPVSEKAERLALETRDAGGLVVADFSEDCWRRHELSEGSEVYTQRQLQAARRTLEMADAVVTTSEGLAEALIGEAETNLWVVPPCLPEILGPREPRAGLLAWWSDGRQQTGFALAAPYLAEALEAIDGTFWHIQFPHMGPLKAVGLRQKYVMGGSPDATLNLQHYTRHMAQAYLAVDTWPDCAYADTVSDLGILRNAALGAPTLTTRSNAPPGAISAPVREWPRLIRELHREPDRRRALSLAGLSWANTRVGFDRYRQVLSDLGV